VQNLLELEKYNNDQRIADTQPQREVTLPWIHNALRTLIGDDTELISKRKKSHLARGLRKVINDTQDRPYKKPEYIKSQPYHLLLELIDKTSSQLVNSRKFLSPEPRSSTTAVVHLGDRFIPENFLSIMLKSFSIMPHYGFRWQYIDVDIATLRIIVEQIK
jgi:hypothetical protein